jgi:tetratricopeptide (TPR) repeat protein
MCLFHYWNYRYAEALNINIQHVSQGALFTQFRYLVIYSELGEIEKAHEAYQKCLELDPTFTIESLIQYMRFWNYICGFGTTQSPSSNGTFKAWQRRAWFSA